MLNIKGFTTKEVKHISEVNSECFLLEHTKTGAEVVYLKNDDTNKVFTIAFRTPPQDDTGIAHIMEHSVLCGSERFPVKELFMDIAKSSLNTFLNAMTYPDKTVYPFASKNHKDFRNLLEVYLDAVFFPNIHTDPLILKQEGWRYVKDSETGELTYNGVVYNEMKGAFSTPDRILGSLAKRALFPDTTYGYESGGDPDFIPELTDQQFIDFHNKYYHPSNSRIFLYGDMDIEKTMEYMDVEFLNKFDKITPESDIALQPTFAEPKEVTDYYSISSKEDEKDQTFFSKYFMISEATNTEDYYALSILKSILLDSPASPLKKALLEANIAQDINGGASTGMRQMTMSINAKKSNPENKAKFLEVIDTCLRDLVKNGIDKKLIEASINITEFHLREADFHSYPKGLVYVSTILDSWLYDADPFAHIQFNDVFAKMRVALESDYFEKLIEKYLLNNPHQVIFTLLPKKGLAEEKAGNLKAKLEEFNKSISEKEIIAIEKMNADLTKKQSTPDSPEDVAKLPRISRDEISEKAELVEYKAVKSENITFLEVPTFTNQIDYLDFIFETSCVEQENIPYVRLISSIICEISTENYNYSELSNEINIHTGGIYHGASAYSKWGNADEIVPNFEVVGKAIHTKLPELLKFVEETCLRTKYDDTTRLLELIREIKAMEQRKILMSGHAVAMGRANSYHSNAAAYREYTSNIEFFKFIKDIEKNFEEKKDEVVAKLAYVAKKIFNQNNITVSITSENENIEEVKTQINEMVKNFPADEQEKFEYKFDLTNKKEGFITPGNVQYVANTYNFKKLGFEYSGAMRVLDNILGVDYLIQNIRIKGGAYGAMTSFYDNGIGFFASYRDPNLSNSLKVYKETADFTANLPISEDMLFNYVVGSISRLDSPVTPGMMNDKALSQYFRGFGINEIQKERDEVLAANVETIKSFAPMLKALTEKDNICVVGSEAKINEEKDVFDSVINLFAD